MGQNMPKLKILTTKSEKLDSPYYAILIQGLIAILYLATGTYSSIIIYMGFCLSLFPMLTVSGMWILRAKLAKEAIAYRSPWFPFLPVFFIGSTLTITIVNLFQNPKESMISLFLLSIGAIIFIWFRANESESTSPTKAQEEA